MKKPRNLTPQERELWNKVIAGAREIHPLKPTVKPAAKSTAKPAKTVSEPGKTVSVAPFRIGSRAPRPDTMPVHVSAPPAMDSKTFRKMKSGKLAPEARIDLHGLTLAEAHPRLIAFVQQASMRGHRLVLVITGKGTSRRRDSFHARPGALRREVPHWLRSAPLSPLVLQVAEANRKHGGEGALYVYLRRRS